MARLLLRDLTPGTNYKIQLRAADGDSVSEWSRRFDLPTTSDSTAPDVPDWAVTDEWVVADDAFVATWLPLDFGLDQNKDFDHYEITVGDGSTFVTIRTQNTSYTLTFEQNKIFFGTPSATVTAQVRSVDAVGNASAYNTLKSATNPAPAAPATITVQELYDSILVKWDAVADTDLSNYLVQVSTSGIGGTYTTVYSGLNTTFTHATTMFATDHYYKVFAVDKFGSTSSAVFSSAVRPKSTFSIDTTPPANATNLVATPGFSGTRQSAYVDLTWTASVSSDVAEYTIRFSTDGTNWQYVKVNYDVTAFRVDDLTPNTTYYFGISTSDFSANITSYLNATVYPITTTQDTTAPSQPAAPTVASAVQRIQVTHTGGKQSGGSLESDLDTFQVFASTTTGFTPGTTNMLGTMKWNGVNAIQTFDVPASGSAGATTETWYVVVKAVDRSGNVSSASPQATSTPGLVGTLNITELQADRITAGSGLINDLIVKSTLQIGDASTNGIIESYDYVNSGGTSGFYMDKDELIIKSGTIEAAAIKLQNSPNIIQPEFASFEYTPYTYDDITVIARDTGATVTIDMTAFKYGYQSLKIITDASGTKNVLLGTDLTATTVIPEDGDYIVSYWAKSTGTPTITLKTATSANSSDVVTAYDSQAHVLTTSWARYERVVNLLGSNLVNGKTQIGWAIPASATVWIDGVQIEKKTGSVSEASVWKPPGMTSINGGAITTGSIRSNSTLTVGSVTLPTWAIDIAGTAQFGDLLIRGNTIVGADVTEGADSYIKSYQYTEGVDGWIIRSDGTTEFRSVAVGSFPGGAIQPGTLSVESIASGNLNGEITLATGSAIVSNGEMGERVLFSADGFSASGAYQVNVITAVLATNVATFTTDADHGFAQGNKVVIEKAGAPYDGVWTIKDVTAATTFRVDITNADVGSASKTAIAKSMSFDPDVIRPTLIDFPTDGSKPNIISGTLAADTLTVASGANLSGESLLELASTLWISSGIVAPKNSPTLSNQYPSFNLTSGADSGSMNDVTMGHDGKWRIASESGSQIHIYDADGTYDSSWTAPVEPKGFLYNASQNKYYLMSLEEDLYKVRVYDTTMTQVGSTVTIFTAPNKWGYTGQMGWDFTNNKLMFAYWRHVSSGLIRLRVQYYALTSGVPSSTATGATDLADTDTLAIEPGQFIHPVVGVVYDDVQVCMVSRGDFDYGASSDKIVLKLTTTRAANQFNASVQTNWYVSSNSGTRDSSREWQTAEGGFHYASTWDTVSSKFYALVGGPRILTYSGGTSMWTSGVSDTWIGYTWKDTAGTTHETTISPIQSFTLYKRARIKVTVPQIPFDSGNADSPNNAWVWVYNTRQSAKPATTGSTWKHRATIAYPATTGFVDPYASIPSDTVPTTNGFTSGSASAGIIKTTSGNSFWKGDDTAQFYQLVVTSTTDATTSAGNKPALRIGNPAAIHQRLDGNEIIAMTDDDTQGSLLLNSGGQVSLGGTTGWVVGQNFMKADVKTINISSLNTVFTGSVSFAAAFTSDAAVPTISAIPDVTNPHQLHTSVVNVTRSGFDIKILRDAGTTGNVSVNWMALSIP